MKKITLRALVATLMLSTATFPAQAETNSGSYLAARSATMQSDYAAASLYFTRLLVQSPQNAFLLENLVLANLALGEMDKAIPPARVLDQQSVNSQIGNMVVIADLIDQQNFAELINRFDADNGIGPLVDGLLLAWSHLGNGQMSEALADFDKVAQERGLEGFALYHKALALASVGDFESAEDIFGGETASTVQLSRRAVMAHIEILSQLERNEDAIVVMDALFGQGLDPELLQMREVLEAGEMLPFSQVTQPRDGMAEVLYSVANALKDEASPDYTLLYSRTAQFLRPSHIDALLLSAELLEEVEQYDLATEVYKSVPAGHHSFHAAEMGRAEALRAGGKAEAAIEVLEQLSRTHGDLAIVHTSLGDALRQQERFGEAAEAYDRALGLFDAPDESQWFSYYARGICHERLGEWEDAESDFRQALELNPGQPQVLNYLGYSLVEKRIKLDEALGMIQQAVDARPDSGYIVDSLGWVLYRLGRYEEAVSHMERATELMPVDPVVNDHLGDVYWSVGRKTEAQFQWMRALSFIDENAPPEADPDRIRAKLDRGLDAVLAEEGAAPIQVAEEK
ncbi:tetratricopeptide repeat protein [Cognatishimia activa]|uniref:Lipoprotein NlpI n=1 Tax=Cognatishimia activa TaxID=1715691 RepID=A0A0P1IRF1_9RHOB|nr:tetratricopeptide repeat protein [Cognatishimia activa]CUJ03925.1 lipoprotein NlpI [Cognatishimia activa]CUK26090.1 lipoprotein NlpI [Cognatishimia activa]